MVELVYLDETGSVGKGAKRQPLLRLVGVVVREDAVTPLAEAMNALAMKHLGWRPVGFEFHAYDVWHGNDRWERKSPTELLATLEDLIALLDELDISVIHSAIHKEALHDVYDGEYDSNAYLLALQFLLEKLERWNSGASRLIVADEAKEHETRAIRLLRDMQEWGGGPVPGIRLQSVIDSMHYVDSRDSAGVQLADAVAFILHRSTLPTQGHADSNAAVERMRRTISGKTMTWREPWPSPPRKR